MVGTTQASAAVPPRGVGPPESGTKARDKPTLRFKDADMRRRRSDGPHGLTPRCEGDACHPPRPTRLDGDQGRQTTVK